MTVKANVLAAIAWLETVASEIEQGVEHDAEKITEKVHTYLHYGPSLGKAPAAEAAPAAAAPVDKPAAGEPEPEG